MPEVIALASKSNRLLISLHNEACEFTISKDLTTLLFETGEKGTISSINLQLSSSQQQLIHSLEIPFHSRGRGSSVRVDSLFPLVFGDSDPIESVMTMCSTHTTRDDRANYEMRVELNFEGEISPPTLFKINSTSLDIDSIIVPVSKEVLGINSDFFTSLFYGDFMEKNAGSFGIKEIDGKDFIWLINSLMERKRNVTAVDQALAVLTLADRFLMPYVHKYGVSYLKATVLDPIAKNRVVALKRYIDLAVRVNDNGDFVGWIFERCQTTSELIEVAQSCLQSLSPHMATFFRFLSYEDKTANEKMERLEKEKEALDNANQMLKGEKNALTFKNNGLVAENQRLEAIWANHCRTYQCTRQFYSNEDVYNLSDD
ncbi:hypothetical protein PENTCL1PPCAC_9022 [Pristionchus entomophagus]|uniref:BTB domain-containing protein n=1 Tax=Pristionchus entomophagus TaxID=358040 RepID=A0AAV5SU15_9BILA|nr:hypothetical protein PENTCL1PPCAC_9022 [Pristionchus entomophagus]